MYFFFEIRQRFLLGVVRVCRRPVVFYFTKEHDEAPGSSYVLVLTKNSNNIVMA